ncbi:hypothetical protein M405DRAFT_826351 [Rhizopogon salebrosus TDB-379]|nr:hypothetical protein M405DRAFT_826351 [Rhizopogon salebrosus TDB-379]
MYAIVFKKGPLGAALQNVYKNRILLVGGSQDETESLWVHVGFLKFDVRVSPVADAMEQDFLGWPPNPDMLVKEMFGQAPAANL